MENLEPNENLETAAGLRARQLAALSHHLIKLAETEKAALARRLHDDLGGCLTVISLDLLVVAEHLRQTEPDLALRLQRAIAAIKDAVTLKRHIIDALRPSMLDSLGLSACLTDHALEFQKRTGIQITTDICNDFDSIHADSAIDIFRIAEESFLNVERHADARRIWISLQPRDGGARLLIEDDGVGIASEVMNMPESRGMIGMRERMALNGGSLKIFQRHHGSGTAVEALFPLSR